jgi:serine/threonine protein kinase
MKPENLLIFKDYKVKLGDFGCSLKLNDDDSSNEYCISGLTKFYSSDKALKAFNNSETLTKQELLTND